MRVPLSWLREFVPLPAQAALVDRLTLGGLEVEATERTGPDLAGVQVGRVLERSTHPDADRLSVCRVEVGQEKPLEIVCGAPNVTVGQKVAVAPAGTRLPGGTKVKRARIRGVVSNGMICSSRELGLGDDHEGILVLAPEAPVGVPVAEVVAAGDSVLEIALTPNRGDCASLLGVAREVRAHFGGELILPPCDPPETGVPARRTVRVAIEDPASCRHYVARLVRGVRVEASPDWLRARIEAVGLRPINNVVDVTNLVLHELGQPLHAFDWNALRGGSVVVRAARADEKLVTLDGQTRSLGPSDLVIADAERPVALAGVMGGAETEVGAETRDVLIESAHFDPVRVRRTARRLALQTEASYRFERGVDHEGVRRAAGRAARLLAELAGGHVAPGTVEARGEPPAVTAEIGLDAGRVNRLLGTELASAEVAALLERVGVGVGEEDAGRLRCRIPSHRNDLERREDLIEEVARIHGYDRIPVTLPAGPLVPAEQPPERRLAECARDALRALGLLECMSFPFASGSDPERLGLGPHDPRRRAVAVENPLVEDESKLRTSLVPSLLRLVRQNRSRQAERVRLFEVSRVFQAREEGGPPEERLHAAAVLSPAEKPTLWAERDGAPLFFEAKGLAERLVAELGYEGELRRRGEEPFLHPHASVAIDVAGGPAGAVGELHPETAGRFEIDVPCAILVLDLSALARRPGRQTRYAEMSRQPRVRRDLALLLPEDPGAGEVVDAIRRTAGPHLASVEVFDRYAGKGVPAGKVSLAFRLEFQREDRALTDAEVVRATERVVAMLAERFGGELR